MNLVRFAAAFGAAILVSIGAAFAAGDDAGAG